MANLTAAIAAGGELGVLVQAVKDRERERAETQRELTRLDALRSSVATLSGARLRRDVAKHLEDWQGLLARRPLAGRQILRKLFVTRLAFGPAGAGRWRSRGRRASTGSSPASSRRL